MTGVELAVLAIARDQPGGRDIAVLIGTQADTQGVEGWVSAIVDRRVLSDFWAGNRHGADSPFELDPPEAKDLETWFDASRKVGVGDGPGADVDAAIDGSNLWVDRIIRLHFFDRPDKPAGAARVPLACFDTAGFVVDQKGTLQGAEWVVSRMLLRAKQDWPDPKALNNPQPLVGFEIAAHIPLITNVHAQTNSPKRYDTRALLRAVSADAAPTLWHGDSKQGPRFREIRMALTDSAGAIRWGGAKDSLSGLADPEKAYLSRTGGAAIDAPFFAYLQAFETGAPRGATQLKRELGLRRVPKKDGVSLALRAELHLGMQDRADWPKYWNGLAREVGGLQDMAPPVSLLVNSDEPCLLLSQEQRESGLVLKLEPSGIAEWVVAARVEQEAFDQQDPGLVTIERRIADWLKDGAPAADVIKQLDAVRPTTGMTALPKLKFGHTRKRRPWHFVGRLEEDASKRVVQTGSASAEWPSGRRSQASFELASLEPRATDNLWAENDVDVKKLAADVTVPGITTTHGTSLKCDNGRFLADIDTNPRRQPPARSEPGIWFALEVALDLPDPRPLIRIGSLQVQMREERARLTVRLVPPPRGGKVPLLLVKSRFPVSRLEAVEQDLLPGKRDYDWEPLLLVEKKDGSGSEKLWLDGKEKFGIDADGRPDDQELGWAVSGDAGSEGSVERKVIVIDPKPFRVAAVQYRLKNSGQDETNEIAVWKRQDDGSFAWSIHDPEQSVRLLLPPQIIAEAMEKRRTGEVSDIDDRHPVKARFGTLTRIDVDPTYRDTATREVGWNLRRMFNRISDAPPGPLVRDVRFEIAYGLIARHVPQQETRLAEIGGIIGERVDPVEARNDAAAEGFVRYANRILDAQASRLAVDKLWSGRPETDFETSEGLTFTLRTKPTAEEGPETKFRFPVLTGYPEGAAEENKVIQGTFAKPGGDDDAKAFPGGVPWAFDSLNILREVYDSPDSSDGRIGGIFFSALGGWGRQRAAFAHGKSIIETEIHMGRKSFYKLERLGRIGGLGNRAKHVVVYRRQCAPPAQFYSATPAKQDEHLGRPILRKVEEYVDILEPERRYPEKGTAVREPGCLAGCRFVTRRIFVDSDWGADVRNEGWMVPLWRRDVAQLGSREDPDSPASIYKKPLVQLLMPGEDDGEAALEIDTPDRLVFYTSTLKTETADNIDDWHAVEGIDFCDSPPPMLEAPLGNSDLHDGTLPPAPRRAVGHDPLTLELVNSAMPVKVGAGRVADSAAAVIKNVTISRARPLEAEREPDKPRPIDTGHLAARVAADYRRELDRAFGQVTRRFEQLGSAVLQGKTRARQAVNETRESLKKDLTGLLENAVSELEKLKKQVGRLSAPDEIAAKYVADLERRLAGEIERVWRQADAAIVDASATIIDEGARWATQGRESLAELARRLRALQPGQSIDQLKADIKERLELREPFDEAAQKARDEVGEALEKIEIKADTLRRALEIRPDLTPLLDIKTRLFTSLDEATAFVSDQSTSLQTQIDGWALATEAEADEARKQIATFVEKADRHLATIGAQVEKARHVRGLPPTLQQAIANASNGLASARTKLQELAQSAGQIIPNPQDLQQLKNQTKGLVQAGEALVVQARTSLENIEGDWEAGVKALEGALNALNQAIKDAGDFLKEELKKAVWAGLDKALDVADRARAEAQIILDAAGNATDEICDAARRVADGIERELLSLLAAADKLVASAFDRAGQTLLPITRAVRAQLAKEEQAAKAVNAQFATLLKDFVKRVTALVPAAQLRDRLAEEITGVTGGLAAAKAELDRAIDAFADQLLAAIDEGADHIDAIRRTVEDAVSAKARELSGRAEAFLGQVQDEIGRKIGVRPGDLINGVAAGVEQARYLYQEGDNVLRLIRAVGNPPKTDGLGCNRTEVAYVFDVLKPIVDVTPALALANRVTDTAAVIADAANAADKLLASFGVRLPVQGLAEDLVPSGLKGLSLSKLFPDMGGINLEGLLKRAGFPDLSGKDSQGVKITRGFDKQRREAWLQADIEVKLARSEVILEFGPVALMIDAGEFRAQTRIALAANGEVTNEVKGQISGDWRLVTGGMEVITFEKTPLLFDKSGKVDFKIASDRVRLAPTLEFLTNLLAKAGKSIPPGVEPVMRGGVPAGLRSRLTMALPPIQTGAFGVTDLTLGASFAVIAYPDFEIATALDIGGREAPFTLAVWLLNGGGYISSSLSYRPLAKPRPVITFTLDVAIVAGVGIGFGFGVVSGGVWLQVGCSVAISWRTTGGNVTTVTAFLLARGNVDVAGLVSANICLRLEISYNGSVMLARGTLRLSFRISMFYTLRVSQAVQYRLLGEQRSSDDQQYADSFE